MAARNEVSRGGKPDKLMRDALLLSLKAAATDAAGKPTLRLRLVAEAVVDKAISGDVPAIKEIFDRIDGRTISTVEMTGADGAPLVPPDTRRDPVAFLAEFMAKRVTK